MYTICAPNSQESAIAILYIQFILMLTLHVPYLRVHYIFYRYCIISQRLRCSSMTLTWPTVVSSNAERRTKMASASACFALFSASVSLILSHDPLRQSFSFLALPLSLLYLLAFSPLIISHKLQLCSLSCQCDSISTKPFPRSSTPFQAI